MHFCLCRNQAARPLIMCRIILSTMQRQSPKTELNFLPDKPTGPLEYYHTTPRMILEEGFAGRGRLRRVFCRKILKHQNSKKGLTRDMEGIALKASWSLYGVESLTHVFDQSVQRFFKDQRTSVKPGYDLLCSI